MKNEYLDNKIILKYCPNYYNIINEEFSELDLMSDKVIQVLQGFIFSVNSKNKNDLKKVTALDTALTRYFDDREFKTYLTNHLIALKVSKKEPNIMRFIAMSIIGAYEKYLEGFTRNLYISKWI
jgi:hypothetical protein